MSLTDTEAVCASLAKGPRVSLADIEAAIAGRYDTSAAEALISRKLVNTEDLGALERLSICILVLHNGWTVIGKSAPASAENFNAELGKRLAYEDCIRQLWPLMGFALREKLHAKESG